MDVVFDRGSAEHPKGHALLYFRSNSDAQEVWVTYVVILPVSVDVSKYVPPFLIDQVAHMGPKELSAFAFPPAPERLGSYDDLESLAVARDDDILSAGSINPTDVPAAMMLLGHTYAPLKTRDDESFKAGLAWWRRFVETFPDLDCSPGLYVIDRDRWTSSGGIACMDMMLQLVERDHGPALSRAVANQFQIDRIRNAAIHQRPGQLDRLDNLPAPLQKAIELMRANIETPLKVARIAALAGLQLRRMERMFKSNIETSPARFYRALRLENARDLLLHTNLSTLEIGVLCGFSSSSHFAMTYQKHYGMRPTDARRREPERVGENTKAREKNQ
ncbi:MAG: helix-turn-helix domain-containing protein [Proteobacteria bacterium]|nr:helix-turn-helix domain-containing protein [Pseudomonadota bacterium]